MTKDCTRNTGRKPYAPPRLRVYGDLREVTLTNISQNMNDPGNSSQSRT